MGMISMKVHQLARGLWAEAHEAVPSLTLGCKRLRPLAPKLPASSPASDTTATCSPPNSSFDLKSFIRPESGPRRLDDAYKKDSPHQVETQAGGTRWNPTQEQIGILETLYRGGMRTPNAHQIEHITTQLSKFGKIEGKNVFYWFQNHKARERQKQKRNTLALLAHTPTTPSPISINAFSPPRGDVEGDREDSTSPYKRKCVSWGFEFLVEDNINKNNNISSCNRLYNYDQDRDQLLGSRTLELFPLHPEGR